MSDVSGASFSLTRFSLCFNRPRRASAVQAFAPPFGRNSQFVTKTNAVHYRVWTSANTAIVHLPSSVRVINPTTFRGFLFFMRYRVQRNSDNNKRFRPIYRDKSYYLCPGLNTRAWLYALKCYVSRTQELIRFSRLADRIKCVFNVSSDILVSEQRVCVKLC